MVSHPVSWYKNVSSISIIMIRLFDLLCKYTYKITGTYTMDYGGMVSAFIFNKWIDATIIFNITGKFY